MGGGGGWSEGNNLDDIRLFVFPPNLFDHDSNLNLKFNLKEFKPICITERA